MFETCVYPCLAKVGLLKKPLQRMRLGCLLMVFSFVAAGLLELQLQVNTKEILFNTRDLFRKLMLKYFVKFRNPIP